jgi:hypothetical protein
MPMDAWRHCQFGPDANSQLTLSTADPDEDGVANLLELAFLLDPPQFSAQSSDARETSG